MNLPQPYYQDSAVTILQGNCVEQMRALPDESVHCCVTSPPYWGLRDYGVEGQIGLEKTPQEYVAKMVEVFREVRRVLRGDGTCWVNLGDSYASSGRSDRKESPGVGAKQEMKAPGRTLQWEAGGGHNFSWFIPSFGTRIKPKDIVGIPWRVAFALQADGWYLRSDIIWCLSGGTWLYVQTDKSGECLMTVKDLYRLKPSWVRLWNGSHWTGLLGISKSPRKGDEIELVLRSGERISCTPTHKFPTSRGLMEASEIRIGDALQRCKLPEPYPAKDCALDRDAAWFAGLYLAEGSRSGDKIQIAGHTNEDSRWKHLQHIASKYGGTCAKFVDGNSTSIVLYGKILNAIVDEFVAGHTAHDKGFSPSVWRYSNEFVEAMLRGYLSGDGHFDAANNRWRLGFCRNYNLERDLRTACARLGFHLVLNLSSVPYNGKMVPTFRGEIRETRTGHHNQKDTAEVVEIRRARCREVYDLGVACEPHLFALASGILTHNSKPNPMPESVTDRPTKAHEYLFLLAKNERYYYDAEAIKEKAADGWEKQKPRPFSKSGNDDRNDTGTIYNGDNGTRNRRSVWTVPTSPYTDAHFATFPPDLIKPCILAGTSARGCCPKCGAPWERIMECNGQTPREKAYQRGFADKAQKSSFYAPQGLDYSGGHGDNIRQTKTLGWQPTCECSEAQTIPCTVLDPFGGSGTTGQVALELGRKAILIELNSSYCDLIRDRTNVTPGLALA